MMLVHHDDTEREYSYGPDSKVGTFSEALMAESRKRSWNVISTTKTGKSCSLSKADYSSVIADFLALKS
jgi:hypothetical protein